MPLHRRGRIPLAPSDRTAAAPLPSAAPIRSLTSLRKKEPTTKMKSPLMARNRQSTVVWVVAHMLVKKVSLLAW